MNHARSALTAVLSFSACIALAQSISPTVIASAGGLGTNSGGSLSYTIGEMAMIETFAVPGHFLTQGFQQPWELITATHDEMASIGIQLYPNPADDNFYLHLYTADTRTLQLNMSDAVGRIVYHEILEVTGTTTITSVSTGHLASGIYLLTISSAHSDRHNVGPVTSKIHIAH